MNNDKQGHFFNHYDLWINNNLLRQGLQLVLDSLSPGCFHGKYVFFTSDNYYAVLNHHYDRKRVRFVLLTDGNDLNFLSELPMYRIPARATPAEIKSFILRPTLFGKKPDRESENIIFTSREKEVIRLMNDGEAMVNRAGQIFLILAAAKHLKPGPSAISDSLPNGQPGHASGRQAAE